MKLNDAMIKLEYFQDLGEALEFRKSFWEKCCKSIEKLKEDLFDYVDSEDSVYVTSEFLEKNIYKLEKMELLVILDDLQFEGFIENKLSENLDTDFVNLCLYNEESGLYYRYTDNFFKEVDDINIDRIERL